MEMLYHSISDIVNLSEKFKIPMWQVIMKKDMEERQVTEKETFGTMRHMYLAMKQADQEYDKDLVSASKLAGGDGEKIHAFNLTGKNLMGDYASLVMEKAIKMGESNACMKRIVAAPTAGSCGVIPAVFLSYQELNYSVWRRIRWWRHFSCAPASAK